MQVYNYVDQINEKFSNRFYIKFAHGNKCVKHKNDFLHLATVVFKCINVTILIFFGDENRSSWVIISYQLG